MAFKVPSKRRRGSSTTTPIVSHSNSPASSSFVRSSPIFRVRSTEYSQWQPKKRVSIHPPIKSGSSIAQPTRTSPLAPLPPPGSAVSTDEILLPEDDAVVEEREENDSLNEVIMAVDLRNRGTVGCCYYVARQAKLYLMEDIQSGGLEVINTCRSAPTVSAKLRLYAKINSVKLHVQPTVILLSTRVDESVDAHFDPEGASRGSRNRDSTSSCFAIDSISLVILSAVDQFRLPYILEIRPSPEFSYEGGKSKLLGVLIDSDATNQVAFLTPGDADSYDEYGDGNEPGFTDRQGKMIRLSGRIDMESHLTIGCAGAVLTYIQRRKAVEYIPGDISASNAFRTSTVEMFSLDGMM